MKDSQRGYVNIMPELKYIKESNERFSTLARCMTAGR